MSAEIIEITVTLPAAAVAEAVSVAWAGLMTKRSYDNTGEAGYEAIKKQVLAYILRIDATDLIKKLADDRLDEVVSDVVGKYLKDAIQKQARLLRDSGRLFEEVA